MSTAWSPTGAEALRRANDTTPAHHATEIPGTPELGGVPKVSASNCELDHPDIPATSYRSARQTAGSIRPHEYPEPRPTQKLYDMVIRLDPEHLRDGCLDMICEQSDRLVDLLDATSNRPQPYDPASIRSSAGKILLSAKLLAIRYKRDNRNVRFHHHQSSCPADEALQRMGRMGNTTLHRKIQICVGDIERFTVMILELSFRSVEERGLMFSGYAQQLADCMADLNVLNHFWVTCAEDVEL